MSLGIDDDIAHVYKFGKPYRRRVRSLLKRDGAENVAAALPKRPNFAETV